MNNRFLKLLVLILGVAALNIVVFSPGLLGVSIGSNALATASGVTILVASVLTLLYGSYTLLQAPPSAPPIREIQSHEDYVEAFRRYRRLKPLEEELTLGLGQLERMQKKKETLLGVLDQRFSPEELSYRKFATVIQEVESLFYRNDRSLLNRLQVFDEAEYASLSKPKTSSLAPDVLRQRAEVYQDHFSFVRGSLETNEEILLKLDKLLLEISRLDSLEPDEIEKMPCMQEIDVLIQQTKYYKN
ncbi:hypothetical protein [Gorillibacterium sp. CAU 1737]|uniref:hypothetical protein n=1 Tax=Gorillibacterium sp. CAU 1737 TaxID=3140362 RepID=UPI0032608A4E